MKPELIPASPTPERQLDNKVFNLERRPNTDIDRQETLPNVEGLGRKTELGAAMADVNLTTTLPTPVVTDSNDVTNTSSVGTPLVAADDDLIEKEWVDKAKKIVEETKDNPYKREEEVSKLQVDYLYKRHGRKLGVVE